MLKTLISRSTVMQRVYPLMLKATHLRVELYMRASAIQWAALFLKGLGKVKAQLKGLLVHIQKTRWNSALQHFDD